MNSSWEIRLKQYLTPEQARSQPWSKGGSFLKGGILLLIKGVWPTYIHVYSLSKKGGEPPELPLATGLLKPCLQFLRALLRSSRVGREPYQKMVEEDQCYRLHTKLYKMLICTWRLEMRPLFLTPYKSMHENNFIAISSYQDTTTEMSFVEKSTNWGGKWG